MLIVKRYGDDAMLEAAERTDQVLEQGDVAGVRVFDRCTCSPVHASRDSEHQRFTLLFDIE